MDRDEVLRLAALARVGVAEGELDAFVQDASAIVAYMDQLKGLALPASPAEAERPLLNVMREDGEPHATGRYTEALAAQFPSSVKATEGRPEGTKDSGGVYLQVRQVISHE